jgi:tetratricopeptide (TPR) repeat protein
MVDSGATSAGAAASGGTPNRSLAIPPTRPAAAPRSVLPLPPKLLAIIGGGVVAVVIIIAIVASRGGSKNTDATKASPQTPTDMAPKADAIAATIERGNQLIAQDDPEAAVTLLTKARKASPDNAQLALTLGRAYFAKLWWSEGVKNFRDAVRLDPSLKDDPDMLKTVLKGFLTTPDVDDRIADFMLEIGDPMKAYLQETADKHPNKALRARAKSELRRYR